MFRDYRVLKHMLRYYKIPLIALASMNRASYLNVISIVSIKESGVMEYASNACIGLLKHRNGQIGAKIPFTYCAMFNHFA